MGGYEVRVELLQITPRAEALIEEAGRTCYLSFDRAGMDSAARFCRMLIRSGHESVFEHAQASFRVSGGSRAFTHQLVRHRLCSFSQQSQRYVDERGFDAVVPPSIETNPDAERIFQAHLADCERRYRELRELGIPKEDARFVLPNAARSEIVVSANLRQWRLVLALRGHPTAQWEIRRFAVEVYRLLVEHVPDVLGDFRINAAGDGLERVELRGKR